MHSSKWSAEHKLWCSRLSMTRVTLYVSGARVKAWEAARSKAAATPAISRFSCSVVVVAVAAVAAATLSVCLDDDNEDPACVAFTSILPPSAALCRSSRFSRLALGDPSHPTPAAHGSTRIPPAPAAPALALVLLAMWGQSACGSLLPTRSGAGVSIAAVGDDDDDGEGSGDEDDARAMRGVGRLVFKAATLCL